MKPKANVTKEKQIHWTLPKLKKFCVCEDTMKNIKRKKEKKLKDNP